MTPDGPDGRGLQRGQGRRMLQRQDQGPRRAFHARLLLRGEEIAFDRVQRHRLLPPIPPMATSTRRAPA